MKKHFVPKVPGSADTQLAADDVTASEIASYTYCAKAWHLEHVVHASPPRDVLERREDGVQQHAIHGERLRFENRGVRTRRVAVVLLLLLAAVAAMAAIVM